jgi:hypothetical protein
MRIEVKYIETIAFPIFSKDPANFVIEYDPFIDVSPEKVVETY